MILIKQIGFSLRKYTSFLNFKQTPQVYIAFISLSSFSENKITTKKQRSPYSKTFSIEELSAKLTLLQTNPNEKELILFLKESLGYIVYTKLKEKNSNISLLKPRIKKTLLSFKTLDKFPNILAQLLRNYFDIFPEKDPELGFLLYQVLKKAGYLNEFALVDSIIVFSKSQTQDKEIWDYINQLVIKYDSSNFEVLSTDTLLALLSAYSYIQSKENIEISVKISFSLYSRIENRLSAKNLAIYLQTLVKFEDYLGISKKLKEKLLEYFKNEDLEIKTRDITMVLWAVMKLEGASSLDLMKIIIEKIDNIRTYYSSPTEIILVINSLLELQMSNMEFEKKTKDLIEFFVPLMDKTLMNKKINAKDLKGYLYFLCKTTVNIDEIYIKNAFEMFFKGEDKNKKIKGSLVLLLKKKYPKLHEEMKNLFIGY